MNAFPEPEQMILDFPGWIHCHGAANLLHLRSLRRDEEINHLDVMSAARVLEPLLEDCSDDRTENTVWEILNDEWFPMCATWCRETAIELFESLSACLIMEDNCGLELYSKQARPKVANLSSELMRRSRILVALEREEKWLLKSKAA